MWACWSWEHCPSPVLPPRLWSQDPTSPIYPTLLPSQLTQLLVLSPRPLHQASAPGCPPSDTDTSTKLKHKCLPACPPLPLYPESGVHRSISQPSRELRFSYLKQTKCGGSSQKFQCCCCQHTRRRHNRKLTSSGNFIRKFLNEGEKKALL